MERNVGSTDKLVRIVLGALSGVASLAILARSLLAPSILSPVLGIVAIAALGTAATGSCGLYSVLGVSTCPRDAAQ